jgi:hypothetical protein
MLVFVYKNLQHHTPEILATLHNILHFRRLSNSSHCEDLKSQTFSLSQFLFRHPTILIICIYCLMLLNVLMDKLCSFLQSLSHSFSLVEHLSMNFVLENNIIPNFLLEYHLPIMQETHFKNTYKNW